MKPIEHQRPGGVVLTEHFPTAWTVREGGMALKGIYDSAEAAEMAVNFNDYELDALTRRIHRDEDRTVTVQDLASYLKEIEK